MKRLTRSIILTKGKKEAFNYLRGCGYSRIEALTLVIKSRPRARGVTYEYL